MYLVCREAVVKLNDLDIIWSDTGVSESLGCSAAGHVSARPFDPVVAKHLWRVCGQNLRANFNRLVHQPMFLDKVFTGNNSAGCTVRRGAALEFGERTIDCR